MGSDQVVATIIEWATTALRDHPVLVAPTLIILVGVVGLALLDGAKITVQVATAMVRNYRHGFAELFAALRDFRDELFPSRRSKLRLADESPSDRSRPAVVQRDLLAQQRLFDRDKRNTNAS